MKIWQASLLLSLALALPWAMSACEDQKQFGAADGDSDADSDGDSDVDADGDADGDTSTSYDGPAIPETCEQAAQATTTVGCLFYAIDLDSHDSVETQQYAVAVSNVNQTETATVSVSKGNGTGWDAPTTVEVAPMSLYTFNLPDYHCEQSGFMAKGTFKVESDVPIIAYQFNPVDGASSYLSDASLLIPATSLSETYDVIGWKQNVGDGDMRAYFTVVAIEDGTQVEVTPSVTPLAGDQVPASTAPFTVSMNEGDVLEVQTNAHLDSMTGSRVVSNSGHKIAVFSGQECAFIPDGVYACDHLEEQLPGLRFWGKEFIASRMPVRSTAAETEPALWQVYASENNTAVSFSASSGVLNLPADQTLGQGEMLEFIVYGSQAQPGDFSVSADKPIGLMQYMIGSENPNCGSIGDPAMVYVSPTEQFLPRYVVLVPGTWINDALIITRHAGYGVLLDDVAIPDTSFIPVGDSGFEVARVTADDGVHTLRSENESYGLGVIVVGWDQWDSYAYAGGMGLAAINPVVE